MWVKIKAAIGVVIAVIIGWLSYRLTTQKRKVKEVENDLKNQELINEEREKREKRIESARVDDFSPDDFDKHRLSDED